MDELMINNKMITKDNGYELTSDRSSGGSNEGSSPPVYLMEEKNKLLYQERDIYEK